jgi:methyl-accepting chemotaxis protein
MNSLRIRTLGSILVAALAITGAVFALCAYLISDKTSIVDETWRQYQDEASVKARAVDSLVTNLGYGGMIHQFKNYVLRHDAKRVRKVNDRAGGAMSALQMYEAAGVSPEEKKALDDIRSVVALYTSNQETVRDLPKEKVNARGIDGMVKISDKPALAGIAVLVNTVSQQRRFNQNKDTKTEILSRMRAAMGYGGMIHQFKNYVLRQDDKRIAKIKSAADKARLAIKSYRNLGVTKSEDEALSQIAGVITSYVDNLSVVAPMARQQKTPEQIDKRVKISDKPALQGLKALVREIAVQSQAKRGQLDNALKDSGSLSLLILVIAIASSIVLVALSVWVIFFRITRPVGTMIVTMNQLAKGDTDINLKGADDKNEMGEMARAVQVFRDNAVERVRLEEEEVTNRQEQEQKAEAQRQREGQEIADRDARQAVIDNLTNKFGETVEDTLGDVSVQSTKMETSASSMNEIARQTLSESVNVAGAADQATSSVQTVASAAQELSASISEISRQVSYSAEISGKAVDAAEGTNLTIRELSTAADRVGEVVSLINDIAEQTNLLALNATIEAARAGDAGKGFAVVASEVKNLASQTAKATEDIGSQIGAIQGTTESAVKAIEGISATIREMNEISSSIAAAVEEQGAATSEISRNVQEAAHGTENVSSSIMTVRSGSEQTGDASSDVLDASRQLSERFQGLRSEVETFLTNIKAA